MKRKCIGIGAIVVIAIMGFMLYGHIAYRAATKHVERTGGYVDFIYYGPHWLTQLVGSSYPFKSPGIVELGKSASDQDLPFIKSLSQAKYLFLNGTHIEGPGLTNLSSWSQLQEVELTRSSITDEGMHFLLSIA